MGTFQPHDAVLDIKHVLDCDGLQCAHAEPQDANVEAKEPNVGLSRQEGEAQSRGWPAAAQLHAGAQPRCLACAHLVHFIAVSPGVPELAQDERGFRLGRCRIVLPCAARKAGRFHGEAVEPCGAAGLALRTKGAWS